MRHQGIGFLQQALHGLALACPDGLGYLLCNDLDLG
jgi:hypothetical protein